MDGSSAPTRMLGAPARAGSPAGAGAASLRWPARRPRPIGPSRNEPPGARRTGPLAPPERRTRRAKLSRPTPSPPMSASAGRAQRSANARSRVMQGSLQTSSGGSRVSSPSSRSTAMDHSSSPVPPCLGYDEIPQRTVSSSPAARSETNWRRPSTRGCVAQDQHLQTVPPEGAGDVTNAGWWRELRECGAKEIRAEGARPAEENREGARGCRNLLLHPPLPHPVVQEQRRPSGRRGAREHEVTQLGIAQDVSRMERRRAVDLDIVHGDARSACPELQALALDQDLCAGGKACRPGPELQRVRALGADRQQHPALARRGCRSDARGSTAGHREPIVPEGID